MIASYQQYIEHEEAIERIQAMRHREPEYEPATPREILEAKRDGLIRRVRCIDDIAVERLAD